MMKHAGLFFLVSLCSSFLLGQQTIPGCQSRKQALLQNERTHSTAPSLQASNTRSDTVDILHYTLSLDITDFTTDTIRGNTQIQFTPLKSNVQTLSLDLLGMRIDSIRLGATACTYSYNDTLLITRLPLALNTTDTSSLTIFYHGKPLADAGGFGGFYFQPPYAYNMGVGTTANPHNFGRVWYPCFDNFVERATYTFHITTSGGKVAYCNGLLSKDTTLLTGNRIRTWNLQETIPSYLACVAVAPYTEVDMTLPSLTGLKPVVIAALPADTAKVRTSFIHLPNAFAGFENRYGPFRWEKVGYSLVPFNYGAMEHATNISYPETAVNGTTYYESGIMAHELSHHWFGDLATCSTEQDMWLNEGWATYSQYIFEENVYGHAAYMAQVLPYHEDVLHYANWKEGGYQALAYMPHAYTYGDHVYLKGATVAHTLRAYMGDSLFFAGLQYHLAHSQYQAVSSTDFRDNLIAGTGLTNLTDFFNGWVFNPGWPHFAVDSFTVVPSGSSYAVQLYVRQRLTGAPAYFNQVPLEVTFKDSSWNTLVKNILVSGKTGSYSFTLPFYPVYAGLNLGEKISEAVTDDQGVIKTTTTQFSNLQRGRMQVTALNASITSDSAWIRISHNYTAPDSMKTSTGPYVLSPNRYWTVDGIFPFSFQASANINYDGRSLTSGGGGSLDNNLLFATNLEDSVVLFYRAGAGDDWHPELNISKNEGPPGDKYGTITINHLRKGDYVLGLKGFYTGIAEPAVSNTHIQLFPNPSTGLFQVVLDAGSSAHCPTVIYIHDLQGRLLFQETTETDQFTLSAGEWSTGIYLLTACPQGKAPVHSRLVVSR